MTALAIAQHEFADCLDCDGKGFLTRPEFEGHGINRVQVGEDQEECLTCSGSGLVPADTVDRCDNCTLDFWAYTGCDHNDTLCPNCTGRCLECIDERVADAWLDAHRDLTAIGGLR